MYDIICQILLSVTPFVQLISFHITTHNGRLKKLHDHPISITKAASRLFLNIAISKQLNPAPHLRHKLWPLLQKETVPAVFWLVNLQFHVH